MKKLFYTLFPTFLLLSGCSVTTPSVTDYRIDPIVTVDTHNGSCQQRSIEIRPLFINSSLLTNTMHYRVGSFKEYAFSQSAWVDAPSKVIANKLVNVLESAALFDGVYSYKSFKHGDLVLEMRVNDFIQSFNDEEDKSQVKVDISFNLIDRKSGELIATRNFLKVDTTETVDAQGGVTTLNKLLGDTLKETVDWLAERCK